MQRRKFVGLRINHILCKCQATELERKEWETELNLPNYFASEKLNWVFDDKKLKILLFKAGAIHNSEEKLKVIRQD